MIMKGRAPVRLSLGAFLAIALVAGATLPAWAISGAQQTPPPSTQTPPVVVQTTPSSATTPPGAVPRVVSVQTQTPPPSKATTKTPPKSVPIFPDKSLPKWVVYRSDPAALPADGQELLAAYEKDRSAIMEDAQKKADARREAAVKALEALQEQYTKAGKLDEAIAIRDYLKAGGPNNFMRWYAR